MLASDHPTGYVWQRSADWKNAGTIPDQTSKNDSLGNTVWNYTYVNGGALINDSGTSKWWKLSRTDLTANAWFGTPVFLNVSKLPYFSQTRTQVTTNDLAIAPLAVWKNPAGDGVSIRIGGTVGWSGGGGGTNTIPVDYVLALHRAADNSWQTLDSAVFAPSGTTASAHIRDYSSAQAIAPLILNANDEIVWGFKRSANFNNGHTWMNMNDSLSFTLLNAVTSSNVMVAAPTSGSAVATFTVTLNGGAAVPVSFNYATADGSALAGTDYTATTGTLIFAPGETTKTVEVPIFSQTVAQPNKTFSLRVTTPPNNSVVRSSAVCTIVTSHIAPPTNLFALVKGISGIGLSWKEPTVLPDGYRLERSFNGGAFETIATIPSGNNTWVDADVHAGITYLYRLVSYNAFVSATSGSVAATMISMSNVFPSSAFVPTRDYGTMWWRDGVSGDRVWQIKTSRYAMTFASDSLNLSTIFPLSNYLPETAALVQPNDQSFPATSPVSSLSCKLTTSGSPNDIIANSSNNDDSQLLESGKFFQRRWQKINTASGPALNTLQSGMEVCAWPDRVSIVCRVVPTEAVTAGDLSMELDFENIYNLLTESGAAKALGRADGSGFIVFKSAASDSIIVDNANARVTVQTSGGTWQAGQERSVGLVIYPCSNVASHLSHANAIESAPLQVTAQQTAPTSVALGTSYNKDQGYFDIPLRNDTGYFDDNRIECNKIVITNNGSSPQLARLAFTKGQYQAPPGYSCILRDKNGYPLGIPVQLSKNWHSDTIGERWQGLWFHALTMLMVPANTTLEFEAFLVGQNFGGVPAASHSQLCLVGWPGDGHQQWEESAIGAWGESLCYDPDSDLANAIGTDSRPLMLLDNNNVPRKWTGNYGGCDFLRYMDGGDTRRFQKRIRTRYQRYGPNLTDVTYAGLTDNSKIEYQYSASIYRSNDFTRGRHVIRYDVKEDSPFTRMIFFQLASDDYNYNGGTRHAYGYGNQLAHTAEWTTTDVTTPIELTGPQPWFSTLDCPATLSPTGVTRGFVIRSWKARINGQDEVKPHFVSNGSRFDLVPPPGIIALKAGDYVEAEIERFYFGQTASSYYGDDSNYNAALQNHGGTHQIVIREVIGNNLAVNVTTGLLEKSYPIQIRAINNTAQFSVTRGVGYVPMTFTGLGDYRKPLLEELVGETWVAVNQATIGKDFWQTDYEPVSGSWQITFNVKLDTAYQELEGMLNTPVTRTFRFRQEGVPVASVNASGAAVIPGIAVGTDITLTAGDSPLSGITFSAVSSDGSLISNSSILFTGSGSNRTLTYTPTIGAQGTATITIYITDEEGKTTVQTLVVTVNAHESWKQRFFNGVSDPNVVGDQFDPDGDGESNYREYVAGTDPLNSTDRIASVIQPAGQGYNLSFSGRAGRVYVLERSLTMQPDSWQEITQTEMLTTNQVTICNDPTPPATKAFYRVGVYIP